MADYYDFKATYMGNPRQKGELSIDASKGVSFTPKKATAPTVVIPFESIAAVNPPNAVTIFFKILAFPFVVLYYLLLILSRSSDSGSSSGGTVKIILKDGVVHKFSSGRKSRIVGLIRRDITK